jgi:hypothetical protein
MEDGCMKRYWLSILLFLISSFWGYSVLAQKVRAPKMILEEQVFDFKEVMEGDVVQHTFKVFNEGDQTLEIKNVKPG